MPGEFGFVHSFAGASGEWFQSSGTGVGRCWRRGEMAISRRRLHAAADHRPDLVQPLDGAACSRSSAGTAGRGPAAMVGSPSQAVSAADGLGSPSYIPSKFQPKATHSGRTQIGHSLRHKPAFAGFRPMYCRQRYRCSSSRTMRSKLSDCHKSPIVPVRSLMRLPLNCFQLPTIVSRGCAVHGNGRTMACP